MKTKPWIPFWYKKVRDISITKQELMDFESKVKPFTEAGGIGILHISTNNTIKILKLLQEFDKTP